MIFLGKNFRRCCMHDWSGMRYHLGRQMRSISEYVTQSIRRAALEKQQYLRHHFPFFITVSVIRVSSNQLGLYSVAISRFGVMRLSVGCSRETLPFHLTPCYNNFISRSRLTGQEITCIFIESKRSSKLALESYTDLS